MKTKVLSLATVLLLTAFLNGCGAKDNGSPGVSGPIYEPEPANVYFKEPVKIGRAMIVTGGYWSNFVDKVRCDQILKLVSESIKKQKNIIMDLQIVRDADFTKLVITKAASGDPPEILVRIYNDRSPELMPSPLRLNEAIMTYGHNLGKIPESCWELSRIGDSIVSIPAVGVCYRTIVANKGMLDQYHWQVPSTADEFVHLLTEAKAAGIRPVDGYGPEMFWSWFGIQRAIEYPSFVLVKDAENKLRPVFQTQAYQLYLMTMKDWADAGYIVMNEGEDDNWLFKGMDTYSISQSRDAVPVKPIAMTPGSPATSPSLRVEYCFEAFNKPEALVTLMDWTYATDENHTLVAMGEEGKDVQLIGDSGYKFIDQNKWELQEYLSMDGFGNNRFLNCVNPEAVKRGATENDMFIKTDLYVSLPLVSWRYALPGSRLLKAWDDQTLYFNTMNDAAYQYISGQITKVDYDKIAEENQPMIDGCIKLVNEYLDKTYDPAKDMYAPAQPTE